jgi:signal transduction histidine kinase
MGAGLAHELNNPLAGILGLVQLLQAKGAEYAPTLRDIETQAQRCSEIVAHLLRFSRGQGPAGPVEKGEWTVVNLDEVIAEVVMLVRGASEEAGVSIDHTPTEGLDVRCDREAIGTAMAQLLTSLRAACIKGGTLSITGDQASGSVKVRLVLRGEALDLSTDAWMATGMGFWFSRQVLAAHGGALEEPEGTLTGSLAEWTVTLPRAG